MLKLTPTESAMPSSRLILASLFPFRLFPFGASLSVPQHPVHPLTRFIEFWGAF